ncbi:MAG: toll/interleukin-1 receptor domain-containing protein [Chloroflexi bacterium]|nr:toll/interleukin-1 receptor domain-containing protein [Chloroflexota bacterium]
MTIYLVFKEIDIPFAKRLSTDLQKHHIQHKPVNLKQDDRLTALETASFIIAILSPQSITDETMLATLKVAVELHKNLIAVRIGQLPFVPDFLRGILPLNFTDEELYDDMLATLVDDLAPPTTPRPILPLQLQNVLENLDRVSLEERRNTVKALSELRATADVVVREAAQQGLRDIAFKDSDTTVKRMAGAALQSFNDEQRKSVIEAEPPKPDSFVANLDTRDAPVVSASPVSLLSLPKKELWRTRQWYIAGVLGSAAAVGHGFVADSVSVALALLMVTVGLTWFNVKIREGGNFVWEMPGPLIGNTGLGIVLALIGGLIGIIFQETTLAVFIVLLVLGGLYGLLIGWLATLRT